MFLKQLFFPFFFNEKAKLTMNDGINQHGVKLIVVCRDYPQIVVRAVDGLRELYWERI